MFKLKKPCKTCPFRRDTGHTFGLPPDRIKAIAAGPAFQCHNTVEYGEDDEGECTTSQGDKPQQCAGLIALLLKEGEMNQITQVASRITKFDPSEIDGSNVYVSLEEMIEAHKTCRHPDDRS